MTKECRYPRWDIDRCDPELWPPPFGGKWLVHKREKNCTTAYGPFETLADAVKERWRQQRECCEPEASA